MLRSKYGFLPVLVLFLFSCLSCSSQNPLSNFEQVTPTTVMQQPSVGNKDNFPPKIVEHGKYLVSLLGCGTCHTDGALIGEANRNRLLAGSRIGIAISDPLKTNLPGVVYPGNLTPDNETGIGNWSQDQLVDMIRTGTNQHGASTLSVMPWPAYASINSDDAKAIAAYLLSLKPVRHSVPRNVRPGQKATASFVHYGIYRQIIDE